jgi:hypothetical protein
LLAARCMKGNQVGAPKGFVNPESFRGQIGSSTAESGTDSSFVSYSAQRASSTDSRRSPGTQIGEIHSHPMIKS